MTNSSSLKYMLPKFNYSVQEIVKAILGIVWEEINFLAIHLLMDLIG
jgi:hypothetical protein